MTQKTGWLNQVTTEQLDGLFPMKDTATSNPVYDVRSRLYSARTHISRERMEQIYVNITHALATTDIVMYRQAQSGEIKPAQFMEAIKTMILKNYGAEINNINDMQVLMNRLKVMAFEYDVLQPLIDDPLITDITVCAPKDIEVRVKGQAMQSNATFINDADLKRFVRGILIRNKLDRDDDDQPTFMDKRDANFDLRIVISKEEINPNGYPTMHIRKQPKHKLMFEDLMKDNMLDEKIKRYIIHRIANSHGIIVAGPPGSGKSRFLNAGIEYIPSDRSSLILQENEELWSSRPGFRYHQVSKKHNLEQLVEMAVVEGCNQIIIGEMKGREAHQVASLANTGMYAMATTHAVSVEEIHDRLADLVMRGSGLSFRDARNFVKVFDTLIYMEGYKVRDIIEVKSYDRETDTYEYEWVYSYNPPDNDKAIDM